MNENETNEPKSVKLTVDTTAMDDKTQTVATGVEEPVGNPDEVIPVVVSSGEAPATDETGDTQQGGEEKPARSEAEEQFAQVVRQTAKEEDNNAGSRLSLKEILGGELLTASIVRQQLWVLLAIACFLVAYITFRFKCQQNYIAIDKLKKELQDAKYKALSTSSQLTERSRESRVLEMLRANNDTLLHAAEQPPYIINIPEK